jgi:hypothetical protein
MKTSEQLNEIAGALAKAQAAMKNAPLNKVNPHFKSKYADLAGIRDAVTPSLSANGIAVVQGIDGSTVLTRLMHSSGQWVESECAIPPLQDMQKMGGAITYARRYSLSAICGIAADEDDDGNSVAHAPVSRPVAVPKVPEGFDNWLADLEATADTGTAALEMAWKKSQPYLRKYLTDTNNAKWEALKAKAAKVAA